MAGRNLFSQPGVSVTGGRNLFAASDPLAGLGGPQNKIMAPGIEFPAAPAKQLWRNVVNAFTGAERTTPETEATPEISKLATGNLMQDLQISLGALVTGDPEVQKNIIQKAAPEAELSTDEKGNTFVDFGEGNKFVLNKPGLSEIDLLRTIGQIAPFMKAAKVVSAVKGFIPRLFAGGGAAGAVEGGLQATAGALGGGEEAFKPGQLAAATALGTAAEVIAPTAQAVKVARQRKAVGAQVPSGTAQPAVEEAITAQAGLQKATGIEVPLLPGQQTQLPTVLEKQSILTNLSASARKATESLEKQNQSASDAVIELVDMLAPPESIVTGSARFRSAAQQADEALDVLRKELADPIYKEALADPKIIPIGDIRKKITAEIKGRPPGEVVQVLNKVQKALRGPASNQYMPTTDILHKAKFEIDRLLSTEKLGRPTKRLLMDIKDDLRTKMFKANPAYETASNTFEAATPAITKLQQSQIHKIAELPDDQLKSVAGRIFDAAETNPQVMKDAKRVIMEQDPGAWNELLRGEVERRMSTMSANAAEVGLTVENIPGQLYRSIFGNQQQRKVFFSALDDVEKKNWQYLETILKRASQGRIGGTRKATQTEINKELKGASGAIRDFFKAPVDTLVSTGEASLFDRNAQAMAEMIFNPEWAPQMTKLRQISTANPASARAMTQLLKDIDTFMGGEE